MGTLSDHQRLRNWGDSCLEAFWGALWCLDLESVYLAYCKRKKVNRGNKSSKVNPSDLEEDTRHAIVNSNL